MTSVYESMAKLWRGDAILVASIPTDKVFVGSVPDEVDGRIVDPPYVVISSNGEATVGESSLAYYDEETISVEIVHVTQRAARFARRRFREIVRDVSVLECDEGRCWDVRLTPGEVDGDVSSTSVSDEYVVAKVIDKNLTGGD
jgi:hypothetical protein